MERGTPDSDRPRAEAAGPMGATRDAPEIWRWQDGSGGCAALPPGVPSLAVVQNADEPSVGVLHKLLGGVLAFVVYAPSDGGTDDPAFDRNRPVFFDMVFGLPGP